MTDQELDVALEALIDATSINRVLESLTRICGGKAEHLASAWQDAATAKEWQRLAGRIDRAQDARVLAIP